MYAFCHLQSMKWLLVYLMSYVIEKQFEMSYSGWNECITSRAQTECTHQFSYLHMGQFIEMITIYKYVFVFYVLPTSHHINLQ